MAVNAIHPSAVSQTTAAGQDAAPPSTKSQDVTKDQFLQLLVAQMRNQDPLNPADGVQFLSQLAQFSQLEQLMGLRSDLKEILGTGIDLQQLIDPTSQTNEGAKP